MNASDLSDAITQALDTAGGATPSLRLEPTPVALWVVGVNRETISARVVDGECGLAAPVNVTRKCAQSMAGLLALPGAEIETLDIVRLRVTTPYSRAEVALVHDPAEYPDWRATAIAQLQSRPADAVVRT